MEDTIVIHFLRHIMSANYASLNYALDRYEATLPVDAYETAHAELSPDDQQRLAMTGVDRDIAIGELTSILEIDGDLREHVVGLLGGDTSFEQNFCNPDTPEDLVYAETTSLSTGTANPLLMEMRRILATAIKL